MCLLNVRLGSTAVEWKIPFIQVRILLPLVALLGAAHFSYPKSGPLEQLKAFYWDRSCILRAADTG